MINAPAATAKAPFLNFGQMSFGALWLGRNMMIVVIAARASYPQARRMNTRSDFKQALLTILVLLVPVAIFIAAAPNETANPIKPPEKEAIPVAFLISDGAVVMDFCGLW